MRVLLLGLIGACLIAISMMGCTATRQETPNTIVQNTAEPRDKTKLDQQHIRNVVNLRSSQLRQIYDKHNSYKPQSGDVKITLYITVEGTVQNADLIVDRGAFTPEFLAELKSKMLSWEFIICNAAIYDFKAVFE